MMHSGLPLRGMFDDFVVLGHVDAQLLTRYVDDPAVARRDPEGWLLDQLATCTDPMPPRTREWFTPTVRTYGQAVALIRSGRWWS
jgi:hypothetical protein